MKETDWGEYWIIEEDKKGLVKVCTGSGPRKLYTDQLDIAREFCGARIIFSQFAVPRHGDKTLDPKWFATFHSLLCEGSDFDDKPFIEVEGKVRTYIERLRDYKEKYFS